MLALLTAIGPVRRRMSRASSWSGTRSAMVPSVSPRSIRRLGWMRQITVSAPGQCRATRSRALSGTSMVRARIRRCLADQHRRRHVAAPVLGVQQSLHRLGGERVRPDPVDGVGRQHDAVPGLDRLPGRLGRRHQVRVIPGAVVAPVIRTEVRLVRRVQDWSAGACSSSADSSVALTPRGRFRGSLIPQGLRTRSPGHPARADRGSRLVARPAGTGRSGCLIDRAGRR